MSQSRQTISVQDAKRPFFVGIDLGGTNIKVGLVDDCRPHGRLSFGADARRTRGGRRRPADGRSGPASDCRRRPDVGRRWPRRPGNARHDGPAGRNVAASRSICRVGAIFRFAIAWPIMPACRSPTPTTPAPRPMANFGSAPAAKCTAWCILTLGTGIGGGIIIGDLSIDGEHGHGAECGHIIID